MTKKSKPLPSVEILRAKLDYDPLTGQLTWKEGTHLAGKVAGCIDTNGTDYKCISVMVNYRALKAHRVAWKIHTGEEPPDEIDHIDGDALNNRWLNLRDGTNGVNGKNIAISRLNKTGVKGVYPAKCGKRWYAAVYVNKKRDYLGSFKSVEDAEKAVSAARKKHGFGLVTVPS